MLHLRAGLLILIALAVLCPTSAAANPVSFRDGWGIMPAFSRDWADLDLNYSLTRSDALGASYYYRAGSDSTANFGIVRYNRLLRRWNEIDSQANVYVSAGLGGRHDSRDDDAVAGLFAFEADYETRRFYSVLGFEGLQSPSDVDFNRLRGRLGFSPYKAPIDALQTWIVAQLDYMPEMEDEVSVTPLLRLFYNNLALEVGASVKGDLFLAGMAHF